MDIEQYGNSSHHFILNVPNNQRQQQTRQNNFLRKIERVPMTNEGSTITAKTAGWQIVQDMTKNILSRQTTKPTFKPSTTNKLTDQWSTQKQHSLYETPSTTKPLYSYQTPRMPTDTEAMNVTISYELLCSFCAGPCIGDYLRCRVCTRACHSKCLFERGHTSNPSLYLPRFSRQDWCCPECSDLTRLLTQDELDGLIQAFELIDVDNDGYIVYEEFVSLRSKKGTSEDLHQFIESNYGLEKRYFSLMDTAQKGVVAWSDFALFYSCKLIAAKDKAELTGKLTEKELVWAKELFYKDRRKTFDDNYNVVITKEHFQEVHNHLIVVLEKKYGMDFIDTILGYDDLIQETSEETSMINWSEFIRELSRLILLNRANNDVKSNQTRRAAIPAHLSNALVISRSQLSTARKRSPNRMILPRLNTPGVPVVLDMTCDESFRKHAKILEKLNRNHGQEASMRKQKGFFVDYTIVENNDEEENLNLPKLKANARDDRRTITDPWTSVKEIEQLRTKPILVKKTSINTIKI